MRKITFSGSALATTIGIIVVSAVFGYIAGFRPFGIGRDFLSYQSFYYDLRFDDLLSYFRFEPGFVFVAGQFKFITGLPYTYFASILMSVSLFIKLNIFRRLKHPVATVLFYLAVWYPLQENTQIRLAFAVAILFVATEKLFSGRLGWFLGLTVLASTFHMTAGIASFVLFFSRFLGKYRLWLSIIILGIATTVFLQAVVFLIPIANEFNPLLLSQNLGTEPPNILSGTNILTGLFLLSFAMSGSARDTRRKTLFFVTISGFAAFVGFAQVPVLGHRIKELLFVFMTLIVFDYRVTQKTLPQTVIACALAGWSLYKSISLGLFSN